MVKIKNRWECVGEYLNRCIGGQKIVDILQRRNTFYYVFKNGHELPLLCPCCGEPLIIDKDELEKSRKQMQGRRLKSMFLALTINQDGQEATTCFLEFSGKGLLWWRRIAEPISPQSAARMRHPDDCLYKRGSPRPKKTPK